MSILQKSIKLLLATSLAIALADRLGLLYASSAGVIALLSVLDTRRSSLLLARERCLATGLALGSASIIFLLTDFSWASLLLFLIVYLPLALGWQLERGMAPSTVLVLHLWQEKAITSALLGNELALFLIGTGLGLLVNLYMPSRHALIMQYYLLIEDKLRAIMMRFETFLLTGDGSNEGKLIAELDALLTEALDLVYRDRHNQLFHQTNYQVHYVEMRRAQLQVLRRMAEQVNSLSSQSAESVLLAQLFTETAEQLSETNSGQELLADIDAFLTTFRRRDLPQTREAFENRALLFQLLKDMQQVIQLKVDFARDYEATWQKSKPKSPRFRHNLL